MWNRAWIKSGLADLGQAARLPAVRLGFAGTLLIGLGTLTPAYLPQNSPWWVHLRALGLDGLWGRYLGTAFTMFGIAFLIWAWFRLRPTVYVEVKHWAILAIWSLPLLLAPPVFSHDAYGYAAQGWVLHNGLNPYAVGPGVLPGAFADQMAWVWRYTPAPYGPLQLVLSDALSQLVGLNPYYSAMAQRIPALIGVALIVTFLPRIARRLQVDPRMTAWFSTINPLLIIDFVGGCHNDALMMGLIVFGLWLAYQRQFWLGAVLVGVAAAIKQPAMLAAYPLALIGRPWLTWRPKEAAAVGLRVLVSFGIAIGVFCGISVATGLNFGWLNAVGVPGMVVTLAPFTLVAWIIQELINIAVNPGGPLGLELTDTGIIAVSRAIGITLMVTLVAYWAVTKARTKPVTFLSWSYFAVALCAPALHTWYLTWGGLLLPLTKPSPRVIRVSVIVTTVLLVYAAGNLAWRNDVIALGFAGVALLLVLLWRATQKGVTDEPVTNRNP